MGSQIKEYTSEDPCILKDDSEHVWEPLYWQDCTFPPEIFRQVMMNLIRNPNINSNHLFRADILLETPYSRDFASGPTITPPRLAQFESFNLSTVMVRRLIPRNFHVDNPLDQTCLIYDGQDESETKSLIIYLPHVSSPSEMPFYHPAVYGIAFYHVFNPQTSVGVVSIHYAFFEAAPRTPVLQRTALHLLTTLHKHGQGTAAGYLKRVQHDTIISQAVVQNTYARIKSKYAKTLITSWVEVTDPAKHVFEDLGIAAFLIELWASMYPEHGTHPGFVDIGCGNGLLVHILLEEGYSGWGFDARKRKSWATYSKETQDSLKELVLIPNITQAQEFKELHDMGKISTLATTGSGTHNGIFPKGTFIISNHADELTPWTPILATLSESPFIMIPCCSHNLTGSRFRAPPPKEAGASNSAYASLVAWVWKLAEDCGWELEKEMLRIPSTRNTAVVGRRRRIEYADVDTIAIVRANGGAAGWEENAMKLLHGRLRGH